MTSTYCGQDFLNILYDNISHSVILKFDNTADLYLLCFLPAFEQLLLKGTLENLLQSRGDRAA